MCGGVLFATIPPEFWPILGGYLLGVLSYVANWLIIYWRPLGVLGHTWSLGIEEQFYLVWPILLLLVLRRVRSARWIITGLLTAAACSLLLRLALAWVGGASFSRIYRGTDTHADGLLLGAALAVWLYSRGGVVPGDWAHTAGGSAALGLLGLLLAAPLIPG